jgi:hypothetical protein
MIALALQKAGHSVGLLNPTVYQHRGAFTDIKGAPPEAGAVRVDYDQRGAPLRRGAPSVVCNLNPS